MSSTKHNKERGGSGIFLTCVMSRVERDELNVGALGLRTARYEVTYHTYLASGGGGGGGGGGATVIHTKR